MSKVVSQSEGLLTKAVAVEAMQNWHKITVRERDSVLLPYQTYILLRIILTGLVHKKR
jgi:hypothetical protein